ALRYAGGHVFYPANGALPDSHRGQLLDLHAGARASAVEAAAPARLLLRSRDPFRKRPGTFDDLYDKLLSDLSEPRILELATFLKAVVKDQSLLFQLTPAGCDLLNACTADPKLAYA